MIFKLKKLSLIFAIVLMFTVGIANAVAQDGLSASRADGELACDSFHAVYAPSLPNSEYQSRLIIQEVPNSHPGYTEALFILETFSKDKTLLSRLHMNYACDGEGNYCQLSYSLGQYTPDKKERYKSFPVVALQRNFSETAPLVKHGSAAYAFIFSNLLATTALTQWGVAKKNIEFFTKDKVPPYAPDVWVLNSCKH